MYYDTKLEALNGILGKIRTETGQYDIEHKVDFINNDVVYYTAFSRRNKVVVAHFVVRECVDQYDQLKFTSHLEKDI